ncbi:hypothetical protein HFP57_05235 [Parasphingopyxis algicola]|uniref:hypothetical protein n=1 Tax=Parasphingopyxis algicola TaxID=2026624 RepID=UPI0015A08537|nr:hypothetical protein [Parasphingopyxis algicola]QLC24482.1 hypothetical protein HFP57_05235 [Parasphingopyxis algicola]
MKKSTFNRSAIFLFITFYLSSCNFSSIPANEGIVECDVAAHRNEIVQYAFEIAESNGFEFYNTDDRQASHGFIVTIKNSSGDIAISYLGASKILIDMQRPLFVDVTETEVEDLVRVKDQLLINIRRICG